MPFLPNNNNCGTSFLKQKSYPIYILDVEQYFESKFTELKYSKFVCSCLLRILIGYLFLVNILLVLVQARDVLSIFYDLLALQFVQQLDGEYDKHSAAFEEGDNLINSSMLNKYRLLSSCYSLPIRYCIRASSNECALEASKRRNNTKIFQGRVQEIKAGT